MDVRVAEFAPDQPPLESGVTGFVLNVLPDTALSYGPLPSLQPQGDAIGARCQGAFSCRSDAGTIYTFAADATKLYQKNDLAWDDVSNGTYAVALDDMTDFTRYGDFVISTNGSDAVQYFEMDSSLAFDDLSTLGDTPPTARFCKTYYEFVFLGRLGTGRNKIQWCSDGNITAWTNGVNNAGSQTFPDGGPVMGFGGSQSPLILLESQLHIGTLVGGDDVFQFRPISLERGCVAEGSVATWQGVTFFLSRDGFYMVAGDQILPMGAQKIDRAFWEGSAFMPGVNTEYLYRITSTVDPVRKLYIVSYPSVDSEDGTPDRLIAYNFDTKRWSQAAVSLDYLFWGRTGSNLTLEELDAIYPNLDLMPISLDSRQLGGTPTDTLAAFGTDLKLAFFNGSNMAYAVDTVEAQITPGVKTKVRSVRPIVDGGSPSVRIIGRNRIEDLPTVGNASSMRTSGRCPTPSGSLWRYHRARIEEVAGQTFNHIQGADFEASTGGII